MPRAFIDLSKEYSKLAFNDSAKSTRDMLGKFLSAVCKKFGAGAAEVLLEESDRTPAGEVWSLEEGKSTYRTFYRYWRSRAQSPAERDRRRFFEGGYWECSLAEKELSPASIQEVNLVSSWRTGESEGPTTTKHSFSARYHEGKAKLPTGVFLFADLDNNKEGEEEGHLDKLTSGGIAAGAPCVLLPEGFGFCARIPFRFQTQEQAARGLLVLLMSELPKKLDLGSLQTNAGEYLGLILTTLFCSRDTQVLENLNTELLLAEPYARKLKRVCQAATRLIVGDVNSGKHALPDGCYAHLRVFEEINDRGSFGMLRMRANAGFKLDEEDIEDDLSLQRIVTETPESPEELARFLQKTQLRLGELPSISLQVYLRAAVAARVGSSEDDTALSMRNVSALEPAKLVHSGVPARETDEVDPTLSVVCLPIHDVHKQPLGTLTVNSKWYGWLSKHSMQGLQVLASTAALLITQQQGRGLERNTELVITEPDKLKKYLDSTRNGVPGIELDRLQSLLAAIYKNRWLHRFVHVQPLAGHGKGYTFAVTVSRSNEESRGSFKHVVRVLPKNYALREVRRYERLTAWLQGGRFTTKVGEVVEEEWGALAYSFVGDVVENPLTMEDFLIRIHRDESIEAEHDYAKRQLGSLFNTVLKDLHTDGLGAYKRNTDGNGLVLPLPNIVELYERRLPTPGSSLPSLDAAFDTQNPGLFDATDLERAKDTHKDEAPILKLIHLYETQREEIAASIAEPVIGVCHGDLHPRNILRWEGEWWLIDFERLHRGHALQDHARLEVYLCVQLLSACSRDVAEGVLALGENDDEFHERGVQWDRLSDLAKKYGPDFRLYAAWRVALRNRVRKLSVELGNSQNLTNYIAQYRLALVFQSLDWVTFGISTSMSSADVARHRNGVALLATLAEDYLSCVL